jgi:hypothetical protein
MPKPGSEPRVQATNRGAAQAGNQVIENKTNENREMLSPAGKTKTETGYPASVLYPTC